MIGPSITDKQLFASLRGFLASILPAGTPIIRAQVNRAAAPVGDFVLMTALRRDRLSTNVDVTLDIIATGTIAAGLMTVVSIAGGALAVGSVLFGAPDAPLLAGSTIAALGTGTGGPGTYTVTPAQDAPYGPIYAGITQSVQATEVTMQLDVFGPRSAEHAQIISTLMRDEFGTRYFDGLGLPIQTFYADDPRQMPFIDAETQYEHRWIVDACLQANIEVDTPMQFADHVTVTVRPPTDASCTDELLNPDMPPLVMLDANGNLILVPCIRAIA